MLNCRDLNVCHPASGGAAAGRPSAAGAADGLGAWSAPHAIVASIHAASINHFVMYFSSVAVPRPGFASGRIARGRRSGPENRFDARGYGTAKYDVPGSFAPILLEVIMTSTT